MIADALNRDNYVEFNLPLAHKIGVLESIYLGELIRISGKALRKNKLIEDYFTVDREYLYSRTVCPIPDQKKMEKKLSTYGLIKCHPHLPDTMQINLKVYTSLMCMEELEMSVVVDLPYGKATQKKTAKRTRKQKIDEALAGIPECDDAVRDAVTRWVTYVFKDGKSVTDLAVGRTVEAVRLASGGNIDVMVATFDEAAEKAWKNKESVLDLCKKHLPAADVGHDGAQIDVCTTFSDCSY